MKQQTPRQARLIQPLSLTFIVMIGVLGIIGSNGGGGGGGGGTAPSLSALSFTPDKAAAGLQIDISGSFSFNDPDGDLDNGAFKYTYDGTTYAIPLPANLAGITTADIVFTITAILSPDTGTQQIPCWLEDKSGRASNIITVDFTQLWTRQLGTALEDIATNMAIDGADTLYITGSSNGDFAGQTNAGGKDVILAGYTAAGALQLSDMYGSDGEEVATGIAINSGGYIFVTGHTTSSSFDGKSTAGAEDIFLSRYDPSGTRQWTVTLGSTGSDKAYDIAIDSSDNVYVVGETTGDLGGETNTFSWDGFLAKFDADGNQLWVKLLGTIRIDTIHAITINSQDKIFITGGTEGVLGIDPSPGDPQLNTDIFVAEYDSNGNQQWLSQLGTSCTEWAVDIAYDSNMNLYLAGKIGYGTSCAFANNTANGQWDAFIYKTDANGTGQWVKQFGTSENDYAKGVGVDRNDNIYLTGYLDSIYVNDDNEGKTIFLSKYDSTGTNTWIQQTSALNNGSQGIRLVSDSNDDIFVAGTTHDAFHGYTPLGDDDIVLFKFGASGEIK